MLSMLKRHEVEILLQAGHGKTGGGPANGSVAVLGKVTTMGRLLSQSLTPLRGEK
jgi:hypothetical protein